VKLIAIKPTLRLIGVLCLPLALALLQSLLLVLGSSDATLAMINDMWLFVLILVLLFVASDHLSARKQPGLSFERQCKDIVSIHRWSPVTLVIRAVNDKLITQKLQLRELTAASLQVSEHTLDCEIRPGQKTSVSYKVRPNQRGDALIKGLEILTLSNFKLWQSVYQDDTQTILKVYPDFETISGYNLAATDNHTSQLGIKRIQRRGEGMEFHQLREYQRGDTSRQIDWKATARKQKIISRDYQDERDQQIIVLLDNGRRMRSEDDQLGHLDHGVNAMSLLSHIALKQGDAVGLMSFGTDQRWLPCKKGNAHINTILNHVYDLQAGVHATDYSGAAQKLLNMQRKRSLVILITNTRDEDVDDLLPAIKLIGKNHLILLANIREPILQKTLDKKVTELDDVYRYCGTIDYLSRRKEVKQRLLDEGVFIVDAHPANLAVEVCNSYLDIKRGGFL
jgi:uncharacterized protein (DUF58 family)